MLIVFPGRRWRFGLFQGTMKRHRGTMDMRTLRVVFIAGAVALAVNASAQPSQIWLMGVGTRSCAWWLSSADNKRLGMNWLGGLLSGMNMAYSNFMDDPTYKGIIRRDVGINTDFDGWIGDVEKACREAPSERLAVIAGKTYYRLSEMGR
jgi:hypothetical protein